MASKRNRINIITLGCSKNLVDSEKLMGQIPGASWEVFHNEPGSDFNTVIINTCGFINDAKEESVDMILQYAQARKNGSIDNLFVMGCLAERYKEQLRKEIPEVDQFFGVNDFAGILGSINLDFRKELLGERRLTTPPHYAYLKISEGCSRKCSFCAIPMIRGMHNSVPMEDILAEAATLADGGTKELILIAQDLTYYGIDIYGRRTLHTLLRKLAQINGIEWIRLHYAYPAGFPLKVLDIMEQEANICKYIDIPLQHNSPRILRSMRRGISAESTGKLLREMRKRGFAIRTSFIVGYPGETQAEFESLKEFIRTEKFDRLGVFEYSHEENTDAFRLSDDIPEEIKHQRAAEIMEIQQEISRERNAALVGKTLKVLIDRREGDYFVGRTEYDSPEVDNEVLVSASNSSMLIGEFYDLRITAAEDFDIFAIKEQEA